MTNPYEQAMDFHDKFHPSLVNEPTAFTAEDASFRAGFIVEELVEFLYAASQNDEDTFSAQINQLQEDIVKAVEKVSSKNQVVNNPLVEQVDALIDTLYFTYGSFVLMKVDPTELFKLVHQANMGKIFPDGKPHYDPVTGKVLKPANWERDYAPEPKILAEINRQKQKARNKT